jgi:hypothetical protein
MSNVYLPIIKNLVQFQKNKQIQTYFCRHDRHKIVNVGVLFSVVVLLSRRKMVLKF